MLVLQYERVTNETYYLSLLYLKTRELRQPNENRKE